MAFRTVLTLLQNTHCPANSVSRRDGAGTATQDQACAQNNELWRVPRVAPLREPARGHGS